MGIVKTILTWIVLVNIFGIGIGLLLMGFGDPLGLSVEQINAIAGGLGLLGGTFWVLR